MEKIVCILVAILCLGYSSSVFSESLTVGSGLGYDFPTIQAAVDVASDGDYIDVAAGTYSEDLEVVGKQLTITGNSLSPTAVTIAGSITVEQTADLELQYLTVDAAGKVFGIKIWGVTTLKYGTVTGASNNIVVKSTGSLSLYDQIVENAGRHGIISRKRGEIRIENSIIQNNGGSGVKVKKNRQRLYITDSVLANNSTGIYMKDSYVKNYITRCTILDSNIGIKYVRSTAYTSDNSFSGNTRNRVRIR